MLPLPASRPRRYRLRGLAVVVLSALVVTACSHGPGTSDQSPPPHQDTAQQAAATLASAVQSGDLGTVTFANTEGAQAGKVYTAAVAGLGPGPDGPLRPKVGVQGLTTDGDGATATLSYDWTFVSGATWSYQTTATLTRKHGTWLPTWAPSVIEPDLTGADTLELRRSQASRGDLLGGDNKAIMTLRDVRRYGIDKSVAKDKSEASAAQLAKLLKINSKNYVAKVKAAGKVAFVDAIVYRATDKDRPSLDKLNDIRGAKVVDGKQMLAPTRDFARALIGTVGPATKEIVDNSHGAVRAGDQTGLSGLQQRYDEQLRGTPALQVVLRTSAAATASPTASSSPTPALTTKILWTAPAKKGEALRTSLNADDQLLAERLLADVKPASALVAIKPSTGEILAAANGPGSKAQALATTGHYPPGSTFKIISSLALLRAGMKPSDKVSCPAKIVVNGRTFTNYSDYPSNKLGTITLADAVAYSCNTAFIGLRTKVSIDDLRSAAESLGVGQDYDVGFASYFGQIPDDDSKTGQAAAMIGQGKVTMSPMAMAQVAASVEAGRTVVAHLVSGHTADPKAKQLTSGEAQQLRALMRGVVTRGSGMALSSLGTGVGAKTGTAEYGTDNPPKTHAWMIAYDGDLAVAVFVGDGSSGSGTAGPILKKFLQQA